ncbi:alkylhydroperoxidase domain protein [Kineococcus sp. SYSU DK001]|uniref:alkylhydroperoxidase domain protein n=1 Tax=Kineococcus sp. SYSU DK001 TaxID=3383122 RepID=UPI003D7C46A6
MTATTAGGTTAALVTEHPDLHRPEAFTQQGLGWVPWLRPVAEEELTDAQREALVEPARAKMPYFRLLARDPEALRARTLTDLDIFFNTTSGIGRAERELAAAATSRHNGCVFCASVHAAAATRESGREADVQRLLDEGVSADLGDERWNAVVAASVHLADTPLAFGAADVERLRAAGLDDAEIVDVVNGAAFFNWANRLMLSLGEPEVPASRRGEEA